MPNLEEVALPFCSVTDPPPNMTVTVRGDLLQFVPEHGADQDYIDNVFLYCQSTSPI